VYLKKGAKRRLPIFAQAILRLTLALALRLNDWQLRGADSGREGSDNFFGAIHGSDWGYGGVVRRRPKV